MLARGFGERSHRLSRQSFAPPRSTQLIDRLCPLAGIVKAGKVELPGLFFWRKVRPTPKIEPRFWNGAKSGQWWSPMRHKDHSSIVPTIKYDSQAIRARANRKPPHRCAGPRLGN
jgi:hypothetical protein